jgi:hypothetical protein
MIEILEAKIETSTADQTGQISNGHVKVRGWLKKFHPPEQGGDGGVDDDNPLWKFKISRSGTCFANPDHLPIPVDPDWYCLPVLEALRNNSSGKEVKVILGLVLLKNENENEYRRVGSFEAREKACKVFRRPTYPLQTAQSPEKGYSAFSSAVGVSAGNAVLGSSAAQGDITATEMEINQKNLSSSTGKPRTITFFSRKNQEKESQEIKKPEPATGRGGWRRLGWLRNRWVESVITIV